MTNGAITGALLSVGDMDHSSFPRLHFYCFVLESMHSILSAII